MKRFTTLKMAAALVFAFAMLGSVASAQTGTIDPPGQTGTGPGGPAGGRHFGHRGGFGEMGMFRHLNPPLTADQKTQMKAIFQAHMANMKTYHSQLQALRAQYPRPAEGAPFDEAASTQFHTAAAPIMAKIEGERHAIHQQIDALLTTEQKGSIATMKAQMQAKRAEWAARRQAAQSTQPQQ